MKANEAPENYPIQFKDKIDEYLWKEHHILGGCCSSIESVKYVVAREVAEKLTDTFIEKAVKFMEKIDDVDEYSWYNEEEHAAGITEKCIEDFKKYMGE